MLFGIGLLSYYAQSLRFDEFMIQPGYDSVIVRLAMAAIILGFGVTAGFIFFNQWLPDAHPAAPAPVSSLLSGIVVKIGIYGIYRVLSLLSPLSEAELLISKVLLVVGIITITEGNLMVFAQFLREDGIDLKRILAYSTITHLGYLILVVSINTELSRVALIYHVLNHALAKGSLFMIAGYYTMNYQSRDIMVLQKLGIAQRDKLLALMMMIPLLSLGGMPLTGGFISKFLILISIYQQSAVLGSGFMLIIIILAVLNSTVAFGGYLWLVRELIFGPANEEVEITPLVEKPAFVGIFGLVVILITLLGVFPTFFLNSLADILG